MNTYESKNKAKTITAIVSIIVIAGFVVIIEILQGDAKTGTTATTTSSSATATTPSTSSPSADTSTSSSSTTASSSTYKDGTYTADAEYYVPHGYEDIKVTLTIANGTITDSSIVNSESDHDSLRYQEDFASAYKTSVVGKSIADLKLSYIAGASDTTNGFNDAITKIQTQAQA